MKKWLFSAARFLLSVFVEIIELLYSVAGIFGLIFLTLHIDFGVLGILAICLYIAAFVLIAYFFSGKMKALREKLKAAKSSPSE